MTNFIFENKIMIIIYNTAKRMLVMHKLELSEALHLFYLLFS